MFFEVIMVVINYLLLSCMCPSSFTLHSQDTNRYEGGVYDTRCALESILGNLELLSANDRKFCRAFWDIFLGVGIGVLRRAIQ